MTRQDPGLSAPASPPPAAIRGRGAAENPAGRFERLAYEDDAEALEARRLLEDEQGRELPPTVYLRDPTRTALARNNSPDIGFDTSLNPYRGCEHGCIYCLAPETPVLHRDLVWRPIGDVGVGDELLAFDEAAARGRGRRLRPARVEAAWRSQRPTLRLVTDLAEVTTTAEHRWLCADGEWRQSDQLAPGARIAALPRPAAEDGADDDYRAGYLAGITLRGGACFSQVYWRVASPRRGPLERTVAYLAGFGIEAAVRPYRPRRPAPGPLEKVDVRDRRRLETVEKLVSVERSSRSWRRGFVAGFFDGAGANGPPGRADYERVAHCARSLGFELELRPEAGSDAALALVGSTAQRLAFYATVQPVWLGELRSIFGRVMPGSMPGREPGSEPAETATVEAVEPGAEREVVDIQTSTGTFYAAGLASHNCYARPTHEYLGFSPGLDFETRILVKEDAPELLRRELSSKRWKPQVIAISGVTDPYQPVERRLGLTRRCLQVLAEFRNPVGIITKNGLVARDADVLAELASVGAASVNVSITSLDAKLQRIMEPRASAAPQRLRAIETLAEAGVPVGVMVAPIVPGITDHEVPAILAAARDAGARTAGHIVMRLPHGVKELFEAWLERHFPDRKDKVLNRVRSLRGGRLNDPRFGTRLRGEGRFAEQIHDLFELARRRAGYDDERPVLSSEAFRRPGDRQMSLF